MNTMKQGFLILRVIEYKHEEQICICVTQENNVVTLWDEVPMNVVLRITKPRLKDASKHICLTAEFVKSEIPFKVVTDIMLLSENSLPLDNK